MGTFTRLRGLSAQLVLPNATLRLDVLKPWDPSDGSCDLAAQVHCIDRRVNWTEINNELKRGNVEGKSQNTYDTFEFLFTFAQL